jgi:hypothetical protein
VSSAPGLDPAAPSLSLPFPGWRPSRLEDLALEAAVTERDMQQTIDAQASLGARYEARIAELEGAFDEVLRRNQPRIDALVKAYEARLRETSAQRGELRAAHDQLAAAHAGLRDSKGVRAAPVASMAGSGAGRLDRGHVTPRNAGHSSSGTARSARMATT